MLRPLLRLPTALFARLPQACNIALLVLATTLIAGCAGATSTREVALDQSGAQVGGKTGKRAVANSDSMAPADQGASSNVKLAENDPLASISREPTGTVVGSRVNELMNEVIKLRDQVTTREGQVNDTRGIGASSAVQYYSAVGAIQARLQQGTTPGNPILLRQWDEAQQSLDQMSGAVSRLNTVSTDISGDASLGGYLLESIKAALQLSGAVDEDHAHLHQMQGVVAQQIVKTDRMKTEISGDLTRLNSYITTERNNMQTLAFAIEKGEFIGSSLASRPLMVTDAPVQVQPAPQQNQLAPAPYAQPTMPVQSSSSMYGGSSALVYPADMNARSGMGQGTALGAPGAAQHASYDPLTQNLSTLPDESSNQTLAIIRFTDPNIAYEKQLYTAVSSAIDQSPNALFTVVAVTPEAGNAAEIAMGTEAAQRHADDVKNSLVQMGLPPTRIAMSANGDPDARAAEVRVLVR